MTILELLRTVAELQQALQDFNDKRGQVFIEKFRDENPQMYRDVVAVVDLPPEQAIDTLRQKYPNLITVKLYPEWPSAVTFIQSLIRAFEAKQAAESSAKHQLSTRRKS